MPPVGLQLLPYLPEHPVDRRVQGACRVDGVDAQESASVQEGPIGLLPDLPHGLAGGMVPQIRATGDHVLKGLAGGDAPQEFTVHGLLPHIRIEVAGAVVHLSEEFRAEPDMMAQGPAGALDAHRDSGAGFPGGAGDVPGIAGHGIFLELHIAPPDCGLPVRLPGNVKARLLQKPPPAARAIAGIPPESHHVHPEPFDGVARAELLYQRQEVVPVGRVHAAYPVAPLMPLHIPGAMTLLIHHPPVRMTVIALRGPVIQVSHSADSLPSARRHRLTENIPLVDNMMTVSRLYRKQAQPQAVGAVDISRVKACHGHIFRIGRRVKGCQKAFVPIVDMHVHQAAETALLIPFSVHTHKPPLWRHPFTLPTTIPLI